MHEKVESDTSWRAVTVLACLPTVDCVINQLSNGLQLTIGPASVLQVFRATLLICFAGLILLKVYKRPETIRQIPSAAFVALALLLLWLSKRWLVKGSIGSEEVVQYGQMAYWLCLWIAASLTCTTVRHAMLLLYGLAVGALLTASSVLLGLFFGGLNFYETDQVVSSAGWFLTAKAITGSLVCGAAVILYVGSGRRRPWFYAALASLCLVTVGITYSRAGAVALVAVVVWLTLWAAHLKGFFQWQALKWFLCLVLIAGVATSLVIPSQTLFARWSDLGNGEDAGSGRVKMWEIAVEGFESAPLSGQLLGSGFSAMADLLYRECGEDVKHTHSDTLDLLLIGGLTGLLWQLSFIWTWGIRIAHFIPWSLEGAAATAVFVDYFCHALLTGQLWGTDVMTYYLVALTAFTVIGSRRQALSNPAISRAPHVAASGELLEGASHA